MVVTCSALNLLQIFLHHGVKMPHHYLPPPTRHIKQSVFMVVTPSMSTNPSKILHHGVKMPDQHLTTPEWGISQKSDFMPMTNRRLPLPSSLQAELDPIAAALSYHIIIELDSDS
jgi:hypothetical protein